MFFGCKSLLYLPDISKWKLCNDIDIQGLFEGCKSLTYLPDISKWDLSLCRNYISLFDECISLIKIPDILKWQRPKNFEYFEIRGCISLRNIPKSKFIKVSDSINCLNGK